MPDDVTIRMLIVATSNLATVLERDSLAMKQAAVSSQSVTSGYAATDASAQRMAVSHAGIESSALKATKAVSSLGLVVGGTAAALAYESGKASSTFGADMELIATQAGAAQKEVDKLRPAILNLSTDVGTGPDQLAAGLYHIESAGYRGAEALKIERAAAEEAKVGHADLESVTNALVAVNKSHIAGVHGQIDAVGQLNAIIGVGNMRMGDLTAAMSTGILPAAKSVGISLRDVGAALAVMTDNGVPAQDAATRLRMTLSLMEAPTKKAADALKSIGISQTALADDMRSKGLIAALTDLDTHLKSSGLTATEQAQVISHAFGGGRSSSAILTLLQNLDQVQVKYQQIGKNASSFGDAWKATTKETAFEFDQLTATLEKLSIETGDILMPEIRGLGAGLEDVALGAEKLDSAAPGLVTGLSAAALAFGGISLALKAGMALWAPYAAIMRLVGGSTAAAAVETTVASGAQTAMARSTAIVDAAMTKWAASLLTTDELIGALDVELAAIAPEAVAAGASMETAAAGAGMLGGAVDLLMGPVGIAALAVALGVIAYQRSPEFRSEISLLGSHLGGDVKGGADIATDALTKFGDKLTEINKGTNDWVATLKQGLGLGPQGQGDRSTWQDALIGGFKAMNPLLASADALLQHVNSDQEIAAAKAAKTAAAVRDQASAWNTLQSVMGKIQRPPALFSQAPTAASAAADQASASKQFEAGLKGPTDDLKLAEESMAHALLNGGQGLQEFSAQAVSDAIKIKDHADKLDQAKLMVLEGAGQWSEALKAETGKDQQSYDDIRAHLVLAIAEHLKGTGELAKQAAAAALPLMGLGKAGTEADKFIKALLGGHLPGESKTTKPEVPLGQKLSEGASKSFDALVAAAYKGKGGIDALTASAVRSAIKNTDYGTMTDQLRLKVDKAAGNWAAVLQDMQKLASDAVNTAKGKLLADEGPGGDKSRIPGDKKAVKEAQDDLAKLSTSIKSTKKDFDSLSKIASDLASKDLKKLALAYESGGKGVHSLELAAVAAAAGSDKYTAALARAQQYVDEHSKDPSTRVGAKQQAAQNRYDDAQAKVTEDIKNHGKASQADEKELRLATKALSGWTDAADKSKGWLERNSFSSLQGEAQKKADKAMEAWDTAQLHHAANTESLGKKAIAAALAVQGYGVVHTRHQKLIDEALKAAEGGLKTFADVLKKAGDDFAAAQDTYAKILLAGTGNQGSPFSTTPGTEAPGEIPTKSQMAQAQLNVKATDVEHTNLINEQATRTANAALLQAARSAGDLSRAFDLISQTDSTNLDSAWKSLREHFLTGDGNLSDLVGAWKTAKAASDKLAQAEIDAANATGQYAQALSGRVKKDTDAAADAQANLTEKYHDHVAVTQSDIDAGINARIATQAWTDATWKSTYATASATEKTQMLSEKFSHIVSEASTISGAQGAVFTAQMAVLADESSQQVSELQTIASEIADETAVLSAAAALQDSGLNAQLSALKDEAGLITAAGGIAVAQMQLQQATTAADRQKAEAALAVSRDQYRIALDTYQGDQQKARFDAVIQRDNLRIATDKMTFDRAIAQANGQAEQAKLEVDRANVKLTEDELALTMAQLVVQNDILTGITEVDTYGQRIHQLVSAISADQSSINSAQSSYQQATAYASQLSAQMAGVIARDQQQLGADQAAATTSSLQSSIQIANDEKQLASDTAAAQLAATQDTTKAVKDLSEQQQRVIDQQDEQIQAWKDLFSLYESGGATRVGGTTNTVDFFNTRGNYSVR